MVKKEKKGAVVSALRLAIKELNSETHIALATDLVDKLAEHKSNKHTKVLGLLITDMVNDLDIIDESKGEEE